MPRYLKTPDWAEDAIKCIRDHHDLLESRNNADFILGIIERYQINGGRLSKGEWDQVEKYATHLKRKVAS
jgi:hypothetical protein